MASSEETPKAKTESCDSESSSTPKSKKRRSAAGEEEEKKAALFTRIFTQKEEILLLKDLQEFRKKFGEKNNWKAFYEMSELRGEYLEAQISEKMRRLKAKFQRSKGPPTDPRDYRIYQLSKSLWGKPDPPKHFPRLTQLFNDDASSPELLRNPLVLMGSDCEAAMEFEKRCADLFLKEVELHAEKLTLKFQVGTMLLEIIKRRSLFDVESSSSGKDKQTTILKNSERIIKEI